jgi:hypothetical protein
VTQSQAHGGERCGGEAGEQAKLNLSYTTVKSPIDGVVAQKNVREGQYVQAGQPLFAAVPPNAEYVDANYKETQLAKIEVGDPATFTVDAYPGETFYGTVSSISPGTGSVFSLLPPENATGNFTRSWSVGAHHVDCAAVPTRAPPGHERGHDGKRGVSRGWRTHAEQDTTFYIVGLLSIIALPLIFPLRPRRDAIPRGTGRRSASGGFPTCLGACRAPLPSPLCPQCLRGASPFLPNPTKRTVRAVRRIVAKAISESEGRKAPQRNCVRGQ